MFTIKEKNTKNLSEIIKQYTENANINNSFIFWFKKYLSFDLVDIVSSLI